MSAMLLRLCCALAGTDGGYAATRWMPRREVLEAPSAYALAMRCPEGERVYGRSSKTRSSTG
eukprot:1529902-Rhodomonas_salina.2